MLIVFEISLKLLFAISERKIQKFVFFVPGEEQRKVLFKDDSSCDENEKEDNNVKKSIEKGMAGENVAPRPPTRREFRGKENAIDCVQQHVDSELEGGNRELVTANQGKGTS